MIEPLLKICAKRVADYLYDGKLKNLDWKLDQKLSNVVFEEFYIKNEEITEEIADEVSKKLQVTKVFLDREDFDYIHRKMVYAQNLEQLQFEELASARMFYLRGGNEEDPIQFDVIAMLKGLLNPKSLEHLQRLCLNAGYFDFQPATWVKEMSQLLPSLKSLDLYYHVYQSEFIDICNCFTEITKLSVSGRLMENLSGISNLKNLEILDLSELHFANEACLMELFELKKLRVLVLSGNHDAAQNIKHYLKCGKVLPELRIMDCSYNEMDLEMVEKLVGTHPNLEIISLIETSLAITPGIQNKKVKLLTMDNLRNSMESVDYYLKLGKWDTTRNIFDRMGDLLAYNYKQQPKIDLYLMFKPLINMIHTYINNEVVVQKVMECLDALCREKNINMYSVHEQSSLVKALLAVPTKSKELRDEIETHSMIWRILDNDYLLATLPEAANEISERAVEILINVELSAGHIYEDCLEILSKSLGQIMNPEKVLNIAKNRKLRKKLLDAMDTYAGAYDDEFQLVLKLIGDLNTKFPETRLPMSREYIRSLMKNLKEYQRDLPMQNLILWTLEDIVEHMDPDVFGLFFTDDNYKTLLDILVLKNSHYQKSTISLLVTLYSCAHKGTTGNVEVTKDDVTEDIRECILNFDTGDDSNDRFEMFRSMILKSKSQKTISWAKWILSHFDEFKEPRPKRNRAQ